MLADGYNGGISIEPHIRVVAHDDSVKADDKARFAAYVEYGRHMDKIIKEIRAELRY